MSTKPSPLGVQPRFLHDEQRAWALIEAIIRFGEERHWPRSEWAEELAELLKRIEQHQRERG